MKIALMTIWREKNFGAEMQCYATVKALRQLGHEVEVIDFRLSDNESLSLKHRLIRAVVSMSPETHSFGRFWSAFVPSGRHYRSLSELQENPPVADIYLAGSDQIWNPDITKDKWNAYFLDFGPEKIRRCSYASSFGEESWIWPQKRSAAAEFLSRIDSISVRESSGRRLLADTFKIDASVVLDPTLLHEDYKEIVRPGSERPTLVYYPLTRNDDLCDFAQRLAKELHLEFVDTNKKKRLLGKITWSRTSLPSWIKNIAESSLVVTPSFHGMAFSLIYNRQFIVIQNAKGQNRSSRITGLLDALGLSDRYFTSISEAYRSKIWEKPIDYREVNARLAELRDSSWEYLRVCLDLNQNTLL